MESKSEQTSVAIRGGGAPARGGRPGRRSSARTAGRIPGRSERRSPGRRRNEAARAALASFAGGTLEYYDNWIYALSATLVFSRIFFPSASSLALLASLATFGVSYVARPVGGALMGHLGDRVGRKRVLVLILLMMGTCTFLVGCLPTYQQIGAMAPVLLVALRLLQGVSVGGETAASTTLTIEVAPADKRAFYTSWSPAGIVGGFILATLIYIPISRMPDAELLSWGWRLPFWLSIVVTVAGFIIRSKLDEPEVFERTKDRGELVAAPLVAAIRTHGVQILRVVLCSLAFTVDTVINVYAISLATNVYGFSKSSIVAVLLVSHVVELAALPVSARLCDRFGRRPTFIVGNLGCAVLVFACLAAIQSGSLVLVYVTNIVAVGLFYSAINASYPSLYSEMFHLKVRQSGTAIGIQLGIMMAGFAPSVAQGITHGSADWMPVAILSAVLSVVAAASAFSAPETYRTPLAELGNPVGPREHGSGDDVDVAVAGSDDER